ncbi:hypothetical protein [uncultured Clostridium sp.]|uniref:hypothetical protein n=1 Tax=uncultured Clostridium sp. TaxID=59620 RepID=UPI0028ECA0AA|nr:hypothetical protein [uncultured Clostridium sp.]
MEEVNISLQSHCYIKINEIYNTTYRNGTSWLSYNCMGKTGYEIINERNQSEKQRLQELCNRSGYLNKKLTNKNIIDVCSSYLQYIINKCLESEEEMYFVEAESLNGLIPEDEQASFLDTLIEEVVNLKIKDFIKFDEDGFAITVYGGVLTQFLF